MSAANRGAISFWGDPVADLYSEQALWQNPEWKGLVDSLFRLRPPTSTTAVDTAAAPAAPEKKPKIEILSDTKRVNAIGIALKNEIFKGFNLWGTSEYRPTGLDILHHVASAKAVDRGTNVKSLTDAVLNAIFSDRGTRERDVQTQSKFEEVRTQAKRSETPFDDVYNLMNSEQYFLYLLMVEDTECVTEKPLRLPSALDDDARKAVRGQNAKYGGISLLRIFDFFSAIDQYYETNEEIEGDLKAAEQVCKIVDDTEFKLILLGLRDMAAFWKYGDAEPPNHYTPDFTSLSRVQDQTTDKTWSLARVFVESNEGGPFELNGKAVVYGEVFEFARNLDVKILQSHAKAAPEAVMTVVNELYAFDEDLVRNRLKDGETPTFLWTEAFGNFQSQAVPYVTDVKERLETAISKLQAFSATLYGKWEVAEMVSTCALIFSSLKNAALVLQQQRMKERDIEEKKRKQEERERERAVAKATGGSSGSSGSGGSSGAASPATSSPASARPGPDALVHNSRAALTALIDDDAAALKREIEGHRLAIKALRGKKQPSIPQNTNANLTEATKKLDAEEGRLSDRSKAEIDRIYANWIKKSEEAFEKWVAWADSLRSTMRDFEQRLISLEAAVKDWDQDEFERVVGGRVAMEAFIAAKKQLLFTQSQTLGKEAFTVDELKQVSAALDAGLSTKDLNTVIGYANQIRTALRERSDYREPQLSPAEVRRQAVADFALAGREARAARHAARYAATLATVVEEESRPPGALSLLDLRLGPAQGPRFDFGAPASTAAATSALEPALRKFCDRVHNCLRRSRLLEQPGTDRVDVSEAGSVLEAVALLASRGFA